MNTYSKKGKLLNNISMNEYLVDMNYITPDSVGEVIFEVLCEGN
ncbi:hypothetical protein [uncultured Chryseobacterium sp.]